MSERSRRSEIRKLALRYCYETGIFDNPAEVDANADHPLVRAAWERAERDFGNGEEAKDSQK